MPRAAWGLKPWPQPDPDLDAIRLGSAAAIARFALDNPRDDLIPGHVRLLLDSSIWWATERDGKYVLRFRSAGIRAYQLAKDGKRTHEHVVTRDSLILRMLGGEPPEKVLAAAIACLVTPSEHADLNALGSGLNGWDRYKAARIDVYDMLTGKPWILDGQCLGE